MNNRNSEKSGEIVEYMLKYMFTVYLKLFSCKLVYKFQLSIKICSFILKLVTIPLLYFHSTYMYHHKTD